MSATQACGDPFCQCGCGGWLGQCLEVRSLRARRAIYAMPALSDEEDSIPAFRIQPMPDNDDSTEAAETIAPPTDREAKTNPENEQPRRDAVNPPPVRESYFEEAAKEFAGAAAELRATRAEISKGFRDQEAKQVERHAETTANQQMVASAIRAHGDRLIALERHADKTIESIGDLKEEIRLARAAADEAVRLAGQALELVSTLEEKLDNNAAKRAAAPPSAVTP